MKPGTLILIAVIVLLVLYFAIFFTTPKSVLTKVQWTEETRKGPIRTTVEWVEEEGSTAPLSVRGI